MAVVVDRIAGGGGGSVSIPVSLTTTTGATTTEGILLGTSSVATVGAQKFSPALHFQGSGWKTDATAGAQSCDWKVEVQPVQGSASPSDYLAFSNSINGGAYTTNLLASETGFYSIGANGALRNSSSLANVGSGVYLWSLIPSQFYLTSGFVVTWASSATSAVSGVDTGLSRISAGVVGVGTGAAGSFSGQISVGSIAITGNMAYTSMLSANSAAMYQETASELLTLSTVGLTTDTTANLLPADAIIDAVVCRVTTTITTTTNWAVGDPTSSARFASANATLVAGTTTVGLNHMKGAVATDALGPVQTAAAKVRITCTGANPGAGVIRITVFYRRFNPPQS